MFPCIVALQTPVDLSWVNFQWDPCLHEKKSRPMNSCADHFTVSLQLFGGMLHCADLWCCSHRSLCFKDAVLTNSNLTWPLQGPPHIPPCVVAHAATMLDNFKSLSHHNHHHSHNLFNNNNLIYLFICVSAGADQLTRVQSFGQQQPVTTKPHSLQKFKTVNLQSLEPHGLQSTAPLTI